MNTLLLVAVLLAAPSDAPTAAAPDAADVRLNRLLDQLDATVARRPAWSSPIVGFSLTFSLLAGALVVPLSGGFFSFALGVLFFVAPVGLTLLIVDFIILGIVAGEREQTKRDALRLSAEVDELAPLVPGGPDLVEARGDRRFEASRPSLTPGVVLLVLGATMLAASPFALLLTSGAFVGVALIGGGGLASMLFSLPLLAAPVDPRANPARLAD